MYWLRNRIIIFNASKIKLVSQEKMARFVSTDIFELEDFLGGAPQREPSTIERRLCVPWLYHFSKAKHGPELHEISTMIRGLLNIHISQGP